MMFINAILFCALIISIKTYTTASRVYVNYTQPYGIHCQVDELTEKIKWMYDDEELFTCPSPYRAGECIINTNSMNFTAFNVDVNSRTSSLQLSSADIYFLKDTNATFICSHGDEEMIYEFNNIESPDITCFVTNSALIEVDKKATFSCSINSTEPYTVTWSSFRRGIIESNENQISNMMSLIIDTKCTDNIDSFMCTVDNGVSFPTSKTINITVECTTEVLKMEMNNTVNVELGSDAVLSLLYSGNKIPKNIEWCRAKTQSNGIKYIPLTSYRTKETSTPDTHSMNLIIYSVQTQDEGDYSVKIKFDDRSAETINYVVNVVVKETVIPFNGYVGIVIGAGGTLFLVILIFLVACGIHGLKDKDDDYLTPVPSSVSPSEPPQTQTQPPLPHLPLESTSNPESTFSEPYSLYDEYVNDNFRRN